MAQRIQHNNGKKTTVNKTNAITIDQTKMLRHQMRSVSFSLAVCLAVRYALDQELFRWLLSRSGHMRMTSYKVCVDFIVAVTISPKHADGIETS